MGSAFHQLCPRYSGILTPSAPTANRHGKPLLSLPLQQQNSLLRHFDLHGMAILYEICFLYNSKLSLTSNFLRRKGVIVKRVHCIITAQNF